MLIRRFLVLFGVITVNLLGIAGCVAGSEGAAVTQAPFATIGAATQVQTGGEGVVVDVTPMSAEALATQPTVEVKPAGAEIESSPTASDPRNETQQLGSTGVYTDSLYHFGVGYPADFVLRNQSAEQLAAFTPEPVAVFRFMNPAIAASQLDDLEPADLEIRIYQAEAGATLESWLIANGLLPSDGSIPLQLFQTANVAGGKVCASTMIAPGCAYFVMNNGWIYQLTPATLEGETMVQTFMLIP